MSIDTLLEAARYLEWQAQQQQITCEEEQRKEKALISRESESQHQQHVEIVTSLSQSVRANHVVWGNDPHRHQQQQQQQPPPAPPPPPPPSLPPAHVPITVIPMVPVVTATPSVPPLPLPAAFANAAAATSFNNSSPQAKMASSPPQQQQQQQQQQQHHQPVSPHLLMTVDTSPQLVATRPGQSQQPQPQPQVQIQYPASIGTNGSNPQHSALVPHQAPPTSQPRPNGVAIEDMRAMDGKRRPGGAGTREVHNKLEKNRRAHLKECFEMLKKNVPNVDEKKTSNLSVLRSALRYIQTLKRKEKEYEHEMERLAREKIATQQRLSELKNELSQCMDVMEIERVLRQTIQPEDDQASTSTASEGEENFEQDADDDASAPAPVPAPSSSLRKPTPPILQAQPLLSPHLSLQHATLPLSGVLTTAPPQAIAPAPALALQPPVQVQPTVIAHAAVSHPSVIQAVSHGLSANHKHLTHIAPSPGPAPQPITTVQAVQAAAHQQITTQPIGHITVHPVAHLGGPLQTLYPGGVSVGHITHTYHALPHVQANPQANTNGAQVNQGGPSLGKPTAVLAPHPVLNPVTMVTVPTFPVSTLKLA